MSPTLRSPGSMLLLVASLCLLLGAASSSGATPAFDHDVHKAAAEKAGLSCMSCHSLVPGGAGPSGMKATLVVERQALCHGCHIKGAEPAVAMSKVVHGPRACETCHATMPQPANHGAGWKTDHGTDARLDSSGCTDCHARRDCVDCHERKQSATFRVHDRSWEFVHGIAARTDPASCDGCHLQADCVACHATDRGRAP